MLVRTIICNSDRRIVLLAGHLAAFQLLLDSPA
jgi:hypothetical protein